MKLATRWGLMLGNKTFNRGYVSYRHGETATSDERLLLLEKDLSNAGEVVLPGATRYRVRLKGVA